MSKKDSETGNSETKKPSKMQDILKRLGEIERRTNIVENFEDSISQLRGQTDKMVTININLQAKVTELLIKMTDLTENVTDMVDLLKEASELEDEGGGAPMNVEPIVNEIKNLEKQNA